MPWHAVIYIQIVSKNSRMGLFSRLYFIKIFFDGLKGSKIGLHSTRKNGLKKAQIPQGGIDDGFSASCLLPYVYDNGAFFVFTEHWNGASASGGTHALVVGSLWNSTIQNFSAS